MTSSNMLRYDQWPIPSLYYKSNIFKFFYTGYNATLPDSLSENMHKCCSNGYSLSGHDLLTIPRFQTRYMKDSLNIMGLCYGMLFATMNKKLDTWVSIIWKNSHSPETNSNLTNFLLLLLALYIPVLFLLGSYNMYNFLFSNSSYIYIMCNFPFFFTRPHKLVT